MPHRNTRATVEDFKRRHNIDLVPTAMQPGLQRLPVIAPSRLGTHTTSIRRPQYIDTTQYNVTGVNRWWSYEEGEIPGVGHFMVNLWKQNLIIQADDMTVAHRGIDLAFRRTYNSFSGHDYTGSDGSAEVGQFGNGWTNTFDAHIAQIPSGGVSVYDIDGGKYDYVYDANGNLAPPPGMEGTSLTSDDGAEYFWTKKNGSQYAFYAPYYTGTSAGYSGRLYRISSRHRSDYLQFSYSWNVDASTNDNLRQIIVSTDSGEQATLQFDNFNGRWLCSWIRYPDNATFVWYNYDAAGNLVSVKHPPNSSDPTAFRYEGYSGYGQNNELDVSSPRWNASGGTDGALTSFFYMAPSPPFSPPQRVSQVSFFGAMNFVPMDGTGTYLQPGAPTTPFTYYWMNIVPTSTAPPVDTTTTVTDSDGHSYKNSYDSLGRSYRRDVYTGSTWLTSQESWDANNNLIAEVDARGAQTDFAYDTNGNAVAVAAPAVNVTTSLGSERFRPTQLFDYDYANNIIAHCDERATHLAHADWSTSAPTSGGPDGLCSAATATHASFTYTYGGAEPFGELTQLRSALGYTRTISYDITAQGGADYGLPTAVSGPTISESDGTMTAYSKLFYDSRGNLICALRDGAATNTTTVLTYDSLNRIIAIADPDDASTVAPSQCGARTAGIPGSTIVTRKAFYADGSLMSTQTPAEAASGVASSFVYDPDGNVRQEQGHQTASAGPTQKWYDAAGHLVEVQQPTDPTDFYSFPWQTRYIYDLTRGGTVQIASSPAVRAYGGLYATQERLVAPAASWSANNGPQPTGAGTFMTTVGSAYDALDRPTMRFRNLGSANATITNSYDSGTAAGLLNNTCNTATQCIAMTYDERGNVTKKTLTNPGSVDENFTYDERGNLVTSSSGVGSVVDAFDADGRKLARSQMANTGPAATIAYHYYPDGTRQALDIALNGVNYNNALTYTYRNDGLLRSIGVMGTPNSFVFGFTGGRRFTFRSDSTGQTPLAFTFGAVGPSSGTTTGYPAIGLATGMSAPYWMESSSHYDAEGGYVTGDKAVLSNGNWVAGGVAVNKKTARGEGLGSGYGPFFTANGVVISTDLHAGAAPSLNDYEFNALQGVPTRIRKTSPNCSTGCPNPIYSDATFTYDSDGREASSTATAGTLPTYLRQYDAQDHLLLQQFTNGFTGRDVRLEKKWTLGYLWGPTGHPFAIGSSSVVSSSTPSQPSDIQYDTLYWDDNSLLFTVNSAGAIDDIKVGDFGDFIPGAATPLLVMDRDNVGQIRGCHRNGSGSATGNTSFALCDMTPAHAPDPPGAYFVGRGAIVVMPKADGISDGYNTFQGGRVYNAATGVWTTPDAFAGTVHDPMSQKAYMWNRNNPYAFSDPSGFAGGCHTVICHVDETDMAMGIDDGLGRLEEKVVADNSAETKKFQQSTNAQDARDLVTQYLMEQYPNGVPTTKGALNQAVQSVNARMQGLGLTDPNMQWRVTPKVGGNEQIVNNLGTKIYVSTGAHAGTPFENNLVVRGRFSGEHGSEDGMRFLNNSGSWWHKWGGVANDGRSIARWKMVTPRFFPRIGPP